MRANGGTRPWKDSVTHDVPSVTKSWVLWDVEAVEIPENEELTDYLSLVSSVSSLSDDLFLSEIGSEVGSPVSIHSNSSPMVPFKKVRNNKVSLTCFFTIIFLFFFEMFYFDLNKLILVGEIQFFYL